MKKTYFCPNSTPGCELTWYCENSWHRLRFFASMGLGIIMPFVVWPILSFILYIKHSRITRKKEMDQLVEAIRQDVLKYQG